MTVLLILLAVLLLLVILYLLALRCRLSRVDWMRFLGQRYAHRGLHDHHLPENSLAAFRRAVECGFGAELDVHLMQDGQLAVIHDSSLLRTAGADVYIEDLTAEELNHYPLEGTQERIPLLQDVLPLFAESGLPLIIELKSARGNSEQLAAAVSRLLKHYRLYCLIESFDPRCLHWLWKNDPQYLRGQLSENFLRHGDGGDLPRWLRWMLGNLMMNFLSRPSFIAYRFEDRNNLSLRLCRTLYGAKEASWTLRTPEELAAAEAAGCLPIFESFDPREATKCE